MSSKNQALVPLWLGIIFIIIFWGNYCVKCIVGRSMPRNLTRITRNDMIPTTTVVSIGTVEPVMIPVQNVHTIHNTQI
jgi:hypothetical protein